MNRSPLSDFNRRRSLFDSPNFVRFITKTLHPQDKIDCKLNSTISSNSQNYSSYNPIEKHSVAVTRKLTNMNEPSPLQLNRGIIQLSLITSDNHLTVKIIRVKGIHQRSSNILIKMTLIPDRKPLECNTRAVPNLNGSAIFNEKFTFEINNDDLHKRLCFSIYNYQQEKNDMQLQGCLSFGIKNTLKKQRIRGWFYILQEDIGELRHKQVPDHGEKHVTAINRDIADLEEHQFTISRGVNDSFGFTVVGDSPTFVGKVTENSPAARCGLRPGDYIVKVNGQNVSRAQQRTVSNLIKHLKRTVTLDIHRYPSGHPTRTPNRDILSLLSSTGTVSTEDSSTCSDSSISYPSRRFKQMSSSGSNRNFVDLAQLGHYVEPKPLIRQTTGSSAATTAAQPFYEMTNSSMLACKGSPTNTFV
ncbi:unnamed protein product [Rotaria magnacalcarata]|uniref:Regulator of G-protein signaling 3 n=4 Tax=Rotaria magnacalcarata TaxID=392030 RepID=A0A816V0C2_9BILA|nr:unnamed protein product [Rotaria magnacalcarata]CAF1509666.1 unnamed protein product [Rotaria magnacalcarata]CAF2117637.1 unnamed protein product [Rotaria magnacalcarata]CAF2195622.1 unnamed protein product [Rotaria magnacalcarata]CAF2218607.1 unnamed protein product [Rotaria magnacalcarata]